MAGDTALTFDWRPVRWRKTRLALWLVVALVGHLLAFYLFQVVAESEPRRAPPVREAVILSRTQESGRGVLEGLEDRWPVLGKGMPPMERDEESLAALVKGYVPTWQNHRPALKPLPGQEGGAALPAVLGGAEGLLPPWPVAEAERPVPAAVSKGPVERALPELAFQTGLVGRELVVGPAWPPVVKAEEWPEEGAGSFMLSVSPAGEVTSCLSLVASAGLDEEVLRGVLLKLKFAPVEGLEVQWGWVDVLW
jgi:hypothetical protein